MLSDWVCQYPPLLFVVRNLGGCLHYRGPTFFASHVPPHARPHAHTPARTRLRALAPKLYIHAELGDKE